MNITKDFPMLSSTNIVYLDNASTTFKPYKVINSVNEFYSSHTSNAFRGEHQLSEKTNMKIRKVRSLAATNINAAYEEIIFTHNCTDSINMLASMLGLKETDKVLCSILEHHSNLLPWKGKCRVQEIDVKEGFIDLDLFKEHLTNDVKLAAITLVSNVTGNIQPVQEVIELCKKKNILTLVDASQAIGHIKVDVKELDCDFLVFSAHKMLGPSGVGVLYGKKECLETLKPSRYGGGMVNQITAEKTFYKEIPHCFESGTPAIENIIGFGAALEYIMQIGIENIHNYLDELNIYMFEKLNALDFIKLPFIVSNKHVPIFTFRPHGDVNDIHYIARILSDTYNIAVNAGYQCCQPLYNSIGVKGGIRTSIYIYNTKKDIDYLIDSLNQIKYLF